MATGGIQLIDTFRYSGKKFLDLRQTCATLAELKSTPENSIPDGFTKYCEEDRCWYEYHSQNEEWEDTGRWRRTTPISESLSLEYIFAIVDINDNLLFGIRYDGEVVYNKGMSDEVRVRLEELDGIKPMHDDTYIYAIMDANDNLLFGITKKGEVVFGKGIPDEVKEQFEKIEKRLNELKGFQFMRDENYVFAMTDTRDNLLFGITHAGEVVFDKGIPGEVRKRFEELKGYQVMRDENYIYAITDSSNRLLFGIKHNGEVVIPKGIVSVVSWDTYQRIEHTPGTLYVIEGKGGRIEGAFINGRPLSAGEEYAFMCNENILIYHGRMTVLPKIWIDHEEMQLKVEYPSGYSGPVFIAEDGMLFLI